MYAHGFNVYEHSGGGPLAEFSSYVHGLSQNKLQKFVGNGFHAPSISAWIFYALSHVVHVDKLSSISREFSGEDDEWDG